MSEHASASNSACRNHPQPPTSPRPAAPHPHPTARPARRSPQDPHDHGTLRRISRNSKHPIRISNRPNQQSLIRKRRIPLDSHHHIPGDLSQNPRSPQPSHLPRQILRPTQRKPPITELADPPQRGIRHPAHDDRRHSGARAELDVRPRAAARQLRACRSGQRRLRTGRRFGRSSAHCGGRGDVRLPRGPDVGAGARPLAGAATEHRAGGGGR